MATVKLNKEKLKRMMEQKDEVGINLGKRWKPDSSSKKPVEESVPRPPAAQRPITVKQAPASSVKLVEPPSALSSNRAIEKVPTLPKDASLALRRAKSVVTKDDTNEYAKLNTNVVKRALAHSLMKVRFFFCTLAFLYKCSSLSKHML
jgi:hypothetical protein